MPRRRVSLFLEERQVAALKALKARDDTPQAAAIRRAIDEYLERRGVAAPEKKSDRKRAVTRKRS